MSEHQSKTITRWFEEVWNQDRHETIEELMPSHCVIHDGDSDIRGPAEFKRFQEGLRSQFADIKVSTHEVISQGDLTMLRWSSTMRHKGTDKELHTTGMSLVRFHDGRFQEAWQNWDLYGVMEQIAESSRAKSATF
jgi:predicted SnoaL-like aldol condensation-catalyzing enzyme